MRVGFLGIQCDTANMGLAALAYAGVNLVHQAVPAGADFVLFSVNSAMEIERMRSTLGLGDRRIVAIPFRHRSPRLLARSAREIAGCDVVLDFTGGDSFSDIYGMRRLAKKLFHKELVLLGHAPLVLAPQTYGPFRNPVCLPWVKRVLKHAALVFARDALSAEYLADLTSRDVLVTTDVAVTLPWQPDLYELPPSTRPRIALNTSGLLWNGGYTGANQFRLRTDYQQYCHAIVSRLVEDGNEVHLVPHVLSRGNAEDEDDVAACRALASEHPECSLSPIFQSPVEAKSYIAQMDLFIGSRMHATIASFTTGVPTIPVAYSRKFAGFFVNLGYSALVDLAELDTVQAVTATMDLVAARESLRAEVAAGNARAQARIQLFVDRFDQLVHQTVGG